MKERIFHLSVGVGFSFLAESGKCGFENIGHRLLWRLQMASGQKPEVGASDITQQHCERIRWSMQLIGFSIVRHSGFLSSKGCSEVCRSIRLRGIILEQAKL